MIDRLDPRAATWQRPIREPDGITDLPRWWRELADADDSPTRASQYRQLAATLERYLPLRGGLP